MNPIPCKNNVKICFEVPHGECVTDGMCCNAKGMCEKDRNCLLERNLFKTIGQMEMKDDAYYDY